MPKGASKTSKKIVKDKKDNKKSKAQPEVEAVAEPKPDLEIETEPQVEQKPELETKLEIEKEAEEKQQPEVLVAVEEKRPSLSLPPSSAPLVGPIDFKRFIEALLKFEKLDLPCRHILIGSTYIKKLLKGPIDVTDMHEIFISGKARSKDKPAKQWMHAIIGRALVHASAISEALPFICISPAYIYNKRGTKVIVEARSVDSLTEVDKELRKKAHFFQILTCLEIYGLEKAELWVYHNHDERTDPIAMIEISKPRSIFSFADAWKTCIHNYVAFLTTYFATFGAELSTEDMNWAIQELRNHYLSHKDGLAYKAFDFPESEMCHEIAKNTATFRSKFPKDTDFSLKKGTEICCEASLSAPTELILKGRFTKDYLSATMKRVPQFDPKGMVPKSVPFNVKNDALYKPKNEGGVARDPPAFKDMPAVKRYSVVFDEENLALLFQHKESLVIKEN